MRYDDFKKMMESTKKTEEAEAHRERYTGRLRFLVSDGLSRISLFFRSEWR